MHLIDSIKLFSLNYFNNEMLLIILVPIFLVILLLFLLYKNNILKKTSVIFILILFSFSIIVFTKLGSFKLPLTSWQPTIDEEFIVFELVEDTSFNEIYLISGLNESSDSKNNSVFFNKLELYGSNDGGNWDYLLEFESDHIYFFKYYLLDNLDFDYKYIGLQTRSKYTIINEFAIKQTGSDKFLDLEFVSSSNQESIYNPLSLIDETDLIPDNITYYDETYFDEIYHVRNAYEISEGLYMSPHVHPLIGTRLIALGIDIFGMNPFGFRFMGALFTIFIIVLVYKVSKLLFNDDKLALLAMFIMTLDFMPITTSKIGTLEPFSIFFILLMYYQFIKYLKLDFFNVDNKIIYKILLFGGIYMGLGWACKWTCIYASLGLVILYFNNMFQHYKLAIKTNKLKLFINKYFKVILFSIFAYVIIPVIIYFFAYIDLRIYLVDYTSLFDFITKIYEYTISILDYHSNLVASHPYQSNWYHWIFNIKPIWYYYNDLSNIKYTILAMNNYIISWCGFLAIIYNIYYYIKTKCNITLVIIVGYLSLLIPNIIIDRILFSYHYYPCLIFLVLAITNMYHVSKYKYKEQLLKLFLIIAFILLIIFLPYITGFGFSYMFI